MNCLRNPFCLRCLTFVITERSQVFNRSAPEDETGTTRSNRTRIWLTSTGHLRRNYDKHTFPVFLFFPDRKKLLIVCFCHFHQTVQLSDVLPIRNGENCSGLSRAKSNLVEGKGLVVDLLPTVYHIVLFLAITSYYQSLGSILLRRGVFRTVWFIRGVCNTPTSPYFTYTRTYTAKIEFMEIIRSFTTCLCADSALTREMTPPCPAVPLTLRNNFTVSKDNVFPLRMTCGGEEKKIIKKCCLVVNLNVRSRLVLTVCAREFSPVS